MALPLVLFPGRASLGMIACFSASPAHAHWRPLHFAAWLPTRASSQCFFVPPDPLLSLLFQCCVWLGDFHLHAVPALYSYILSLLLLLISPVFLSLRPSCGCGPVQGVFVQVGQELAPLVRLDVPCMLN